MFIIGGEIPRHRRIPSWDNFHMKRRRA